METRSLDTLITIDCACLSPEYDAAYPVSIPGHANHHPCVYDSRTKAISIGDDRGIAVAVERLRN